MTEKFINLEVAIKLLERHGLSNGGVLGHHSGKCDLAAELLRSIPASDVVERKKGNWEKVLFDHQYFGCTPFAYYCSECNQIVMFRTFFCPNCGAKMDGGQENG